MRISQARMAFTSEHASTQMDAQIKEESHQEIRQRRRWNRPENRRLISGMLIDRVNISQTRKVEAQSNYSGTVQSHSSVTSLDKDPLAEYEQEQTIQKIVGGVIDREVAVRHIRRNEDVRLDIGQPAADGDDDTSKARDIDGEERPRGLMQSRSLRASRLELNRTQIHFEQEEALFSSQGQVTTEDGRVIDFSLDMSLDRSFLSRTQEQTLIHRWQEQINLTDPLVISLDGSVPSLSDTVFEFDLDSDGKQDLINFTSAGSGFLAFDKNEDQVINDGSELFGPGTGNGFNELAAFDDDQNRWIDENDAVFSKLAVWTKDATGKDRLISLKDAGIGAIALDHADTLFNIKDVDNQLNGQMKQSGIFLFENGNVGSLHQVDLVSHTPEAPVIAEQPAESIEQIPTDEPAIGPQFLSAPPDRTAASGVSASQSPAGTSGSN